MFQGTTLKINKTNSHDIKYLLHYNFTYLYFLFYLILLTLKFWVTYHCSDTQPHAYVSVSILTITRDHILHQKCKICKSHCFTFLCYQFFGHRTSTLEVI